MKNQIKVGIHEFIWIERKRQNLSRNQLAEMSGIDAQKIGRIERGERRAMFDDVMLLLDALGYCWNVVKNR